jgi:hypothetical protein
MPLPTASGGGFKSPVSVLLPPSRFFPSPRVLPFPRFCGAGSDFSCGRASWVVSMGCVSGSVVFKSVVPVEWLHFESVPWFVSLVFRKIWC